MDLEGVKYRSPFLAFLLGILFGGGAFFYLLPFRKAVKPFLLTLLLDLLSLGVLLIPVHLLSAFFAMRLAFHSSPFSFHGSDRTLVGVLKEPVPENQPASSPRFFSSL